MLLMVHTLNTSMATSCKFPYLIAGPHLSKSCLEYVVILHRAFSSKSDHCFGTDALMVERKNLLV